MKSIQLVAFSPGLKDHIQTRIKSQRPIRNSAIITDGVHIAHGVSQWNPRHENLSPPTLRKDDNNDIRYIGDNNWQLFVNDKPNKM